MAIYPPLGPPPEYQKLFPNPTTPPGTETSYQPTQNAFPSLSESSTNNFSKLIRTPMTKSGPLATSPADFILNVNQNIISLCGKNVTPWDVQVVGSQCPYNIAEEDWETIRQTYALSEKPTIDAPSDLDLRVGFAINDCQPGQLPWNSKTILQNFQTAIDTTLYEMGVPNDWISDSEYYPVMRKVIFKPPPKNSLAFVVVKIKPSPEDQPIDIVWAIKIPKSHLFVEDSLKATVLYPHFSSGYDHFFLQSRLPPRLIFKCMTDGELLIDPEFLQLPHCDGKIWPRLQQKWCDGRSYFNGCKQTEETLLKKSSCRKYGFSEFLCDVAKSKAKKNPTLAFTGALQAIISYSHTYPERDPSDLWTITSTSLEKQISKEQLPDVLKTIDTVARHPYTEWTTFSSLLQTLGFWLPTQGIWKKCFVGKAFGLRVSTTPAPYHLMGPVPTGEKLTSVTDGLNRISLKSPEHKETVTEFAKLYHLLRNKTTLSNEINYWREKPDQFPQVHLPRIEEHSHDFLRELHIHTRILLLSRLPSGTWPPFDEWMSILQSLSKLKTKKSKRWLFDGLEYTLITSLQQRKMTLTCTCKFLEEGRDPFIGYCQDLLKSRHIPCQIESLQRLRQWYEEKNTLIDIQKIFKTLDRDFPGISKLAIRKSENGSSPTDIFKWAEDVLAETPENRLRRSTSKRLQPFLQSADLQPGTPPARKSLEHLPHRLVKQEAHRWLDSDSKNATDILTAIKKREIIDWEITTCLLKAAVKNEDPALAKELIEFCKVFSNKNLPKKISHESLKLLRQTLDFAESLNPELCQALLDKKWSLINHISQANFTADPNEPLLWHRLLHLINQEGTNLIKKVLSHPQPEEIRKALLSPHNRKQWASLSLLSVQQYTEPKLKEELLNNIKADPEISNELFNTLSQQPNLLENYPSLAKLHVELLETRQIPSEHLASWSNSQLITLFKALLPQKNTTQHLILLLEEVGRRKNASLLRELLNALTKSCPFHTESDQKAFGEALLNTLEICSPLSKGITKDLLENAAQFNKNLGREFTLSIYKKYLSQHLETSLKDPQTLVSLIELRQIILTNTEALPEEIDFKLVDAAINSKLKPDAHYKAWKLIEKTYQPGSPLTEEPLTRAIKILKLLNHSNKKNKSIVSLTNEINKSLESCILVNPTTTTLLSLAESLYTLGQYSHSLKHFENIFQPDFNKNILAQPKYRHRFLNLLVHTIHQRNRDNQSLDLDFFYHALTIDFKMLFINNGKFDLGDKLLPSQIATAYTHILNGIVNSPNLNRYIEIFLQVINLVDQDLQEDNTMMKCEDQSIAFIFHSDIALQLYQNGYQHPDYQYGKLKIAGVIKALHIGLTSKIKCKGPKHQINSAIKLWKLTEKLTSPQLFKPALKIRYDYLMQLHAFGADKKIVIEFLKNTVEFYLKFSDDSNATTASQAPANLLSTFTQLGYFNEVSPLRYELAEKMTQHAIKTTKWENLTVASYKSIATTLSIWAGSPIQAGKTRTYSKDAIKVGAKIIQEVLPQESISADERLGIASPTLIGIVLDKLENDQTLVETRREAVSTFVDYLTKLCTKKDLLAYSSTMVQIYQLAFIKFKLYRNCPHERLELCRKTLEGFLKLGLPEMQNQHYEVTSNLGRLFYLWFTSPGSQESDFTPIRNCMEQFFHHAIINNEAHNHICRDVLSQFVKLRHNKNQTPEERMWISKLFFQSSLCYTQIPYRIVNFSTINTIFQGLCEYIDSDNNILFNRGVFGLGINHEFILEEIEKDMFWREELHIQYFQMVNHFIEKILTRLETMEDLWDQKKHPNHSVLLYQLLFTLKNTYTSKEYQACVINQAVRLGKLVTNDLDKSDLSLASSQERIILGWRIAKMFTACPSINEEQTIQLMELNERLGKSPSLCTSDLNNSKLVVDYETFTGTRLDYRPSLPKTL